MFGGLPTPTETEAPENPLNGGSCPPSSVVSAHDFSQHVDRPPGAVAGISGETDDNLQNLPLTTSQSGHISLR